METKRLSLHELYMQMAELVAERSTCARLQVGAVIVNNEMSKVVSIGYNGNYRGGPNHCDSDEPGKCGCLHAEINALLKNNYGEGTIMFVTDAPCETCAKSIINGGIQEIFFRRDYRRKEGVELLRNHIKVKQI